MTDVMSRPGISIPALLDQLRLLKVEKDAIEAQIKSINNQLSGLITERVQYVDENGERWGASVITKEDPVVDLDRLREISEELYVDCTKRVLDSQAFKQMLISGAISQDVAIEVARVRTSSPYIKFTKWEEAGHE